MNRTTILTSYEDILGKIEGLRYIDFDDKSYKNTNIISVRKIIDESKGGKVSISLYNDDLQRKLPEYLKKHGASIDTKEKLLSFLRFVLSSHVLLSAHDIIIYRILLSNYMQHNTKGVATITLDDIHKKYRGKSFMYKGGKERFSDETLKAYITSLVKLSHINVHISFADSSSKTFVAYKNDETYYFKHPLLQIKSTLSVECLTNEPITYSLGKFGEYLSRFRHYGAHVPIKLYQINFNQIDILTMALYIGKMMFINRRGKKFYRLYISTLLSNIIKYNSKGISTGITYYDYLRSQNANTRTKKLKQLEKQLTFVFDTMIEDEKITNYKLSNKMTYKNIIDNELYVKITF